VNWPKLRRVFTYAATGIGAVIVIAWATYCWTDREGQRNLERCRRIQPGVMVADLTRQLTGAEFYRGYDGRGLGSHLLRLVWPLLQLRLGTIQLADEFWS